MGAPEITDHALVRFLERGADLDVEKLRKRLSMSLQRAHAAARSVTQSDYLIKADGLTFVVRGERVTTVLPTGSHGYDYHKLDQRRGGER